MKLLLIGPYPVRNNGISKYIAQYREELLRQGHDVETECMYFWRDKTRNHHWLSLRRRLKDGFDAVIVQHTPTVSGPLLPLFLRAARKAGVPTVVMGHEPPSVYARHLPRLLRPLYHAYERSLYDLATVGVVHTRLHADELAGIGLARPPVIIPHPVFQDNALPTDAKPREPRWAYFGMISSKKGVDLLLQAYQSRPPGHFPPLSILGEAAPGHEAYVDELKKSVEAPYASFIEFTGYVEDDRLPAVLAPTSLMIFPYRWVSQSGSLAHACLYRIPYLASDLPYFADFARTYGCGRLFHSGSAESLAGALEESLRNPLPVGDAAFDKVVADLGISRCARRLVEAIQNATLAR